MRPRWLVSSLGVTLTRVTTDNDACCRDIAFRDACKYLGMHCIRARPLTRRTDVKAEGFSKGVDLRAYGGAYSASDPFDAELPISTDKHNWRRPRGGLNATPLISVVEPTMYTLLGFTT